MLGGAENVLFHTTNLTRTSKTNYKYKQLQAQVQATVCAVESCGRLEQGLRERVGAPSNPQTGKNQVMVVEAGWPRAAVLVLWASAGSATPLLGLLVGERGRKEGTRVHQKKSMPHLVKERAASINHTSF